MKRLGESLFSPDILPKYPKVESEADINNIELEKLSVILSEYKFSFSDKSISYDKIDIFFNTIIPLWIEAAPKEELESFVENHIVNILNHTSIKKYCKHNFEIYCTFIALITKKLCSRESLLTFLLNESIFYKVIRHERKFHKCFLNINFPVYVDILQEHEDNRIFLGICNIFKKCFLIKNLVEFETTLDELLHVVEIDQKENTRFSKYLQKFIASSYNFPIKGASIASRIIFKSLFLSTTDFKLIYKFFIVVTEIVGFDLSQDFDCNKISKYLQSNQKLDQSLEFISDILGIIKDNKYDLSCSVSISFSQFIENIVNSVMNLTKVPSKISYKILIHSIEIHPLLVEKNLNNLLIYSMLSNNANFEDEYMSFLLKIFETYDKLHRIQNLISKMLHVLKSNHQHYSLEGSYSFKGEYVAIKDVELSLDVKNALPNTVLNYFNQCIVQMASWQVMNLLKTFIFHLDATVSSFMESNEVHQNNFLELLCKFTSWLLCSIRMAENTASDTVLKNFNNSMTDLKNILSKLGEALLKQAHNKVLVGAFLNLSYDWTEMYIVFHYYTRSYLPCQEIFCDENNANYIHAFLTRKQWVLLSQRLANFGESNCKQLMLKLLVQKLRAIHVFGNELNDAMQQEVIEQISLELKDNYKYIISEKFVNKFLLDKLELDAIISIAEHISRMEEVPIDVKDSKILSTAVAFVTFSKIAKIYKLNSNSSFMRLHSQFDKNEFFANTEDYDSVLPTLKNIYEKNLWEDDGNIKNISEDKLKICLQCWQQLPLPYLSTNVQSFIVISLFSLHKTFWLTSENEVKYLIETLIVGMLRTVKLDLMNLFEPKSLVQNISKNFEEKEKIMSIISERVFENEISLRNFVPGIHYLLENLDEINNLRHSILILNDLQKGKRSQKSAEFKKLCLEIRQDTLNKLFEFITKSEINPTLIPTYVSCLKQSLIEDNSENLNQLMKLMDGYLDVVFKLEDKHLPLGCSSFFSTIFHHKQTLKMPPELPLKVWNYCKLKVIPSGELQDILQLICLIFENIPNESFRNVTEDLIRITEESLESKDFLQLSKHLSTWSRILTSSFNPVKVQIWQQALETILVKLNIFKEAACFNQTIFDEITQFEVAVIKHTQLILTATMVGVFLMSPVTLMKIENCEFYYMFHNSMDYLDNLLKCRHTLIIDRLPPFLKIFRLLLSSLCQKCNQNETSEMDRMADCAHRLEKFIKILVLSKKDVSSIAPHLIADLLQQYEKTTIYPKMKVHLNNCIYSLISTCDKHAVSYLRRDLSNASTELFKIMYDNYKRFYRFTGKV